VNELVIRPAQQAAMELRAQKGQTTFAGSALDSEKAEDLVRSTASTGNDASASIQEQPESRPVRIRLSKDAVLFRSEADNVEASADEALSALRRRYDQIRSQISTEKPR
jgi:hypothetical protein